MAKAAITAGTVVHLPSDEFKMSVLSVDGEMAKCAWHEKEVLKLHEFPIAALKKWSPPRPLKAIEISFVHAKTETREDLAKMSARLEEILIGARAKLKEEEISDFTALQNQLARRIEILYGTDNARLP